MKKEDRLLLAKTFLANMTNTIMEDVAKMPDEFDGFEVRAYCREAFSHEGNHNARMYSAWTRTRAKDFKNWRMVNPVRY